MAEVEDLWIKAFGKEHVVERKTIARKLRSALQVYFNKVSCAKGHSSKRELLNRWKKAENVDCIFDLLQPKSDPSSFPESEFLFYTSQSNGHEGHVTDEIDHSYEQPGSSSEPMELDEDIAEPVMEMPADVGTEYVNFHCPEEDFPVVTDSSLDVRNIRSGRIFPFSHNDSLNRPLPSQLKQIHKYTNT